MSWPRRPGAARRTGWRGAPARADDRPAYRALRGAVLLVLVWVCLARLGLFDVAGVAELRGLPVGALVGAVLGWRRWSMPLWVLGGGAVSLLVLVSATPIMRAPVAALIAAGATDARGAGADALVATDAIFVLSAAVTDAGLIGGQGPERLLYALELARASGRPLVVSAVRPRHRAEASSLPDQQRLARLAGLSQPPLVLDSVSSTRMEAVRLAELARRRGWREVAVVTSPLHARRACAAVARVGLVVRCRPSPSRELALTGATFLHGTEERTRAFGLWLYEVIGWWQYRSRGWV